MAEYVWIDGSNGLRSKTKVSFLVTLHLLVILSTERMVLNMLSATTVLAEWEPSELWLMEISLFGFGIGRYSQSP